MSALKCKDGVHGLTIHLGHEPPARAAARQPPLCPANDRTFFGDATCRKGPIGPDYPGGARSIASHVPLSSDALLLPIVHS